MRLTGEIYGLIRKKNVKLDKCLNFQTFNIINYTKSPQFFLKKKTIKFKLKWITSTNKHGGKKIKKIKEKEKDINGFEREKWRIIFRLWSKALQLLYLITHLVQNFSNLLYKTRYAKLTIQFKI